MARNNTFSRKQNRARVNSLPSTPVADLQNVDFCDRLKSIDKLTAQQELVDLLDQQGFSRPHPSAVKYFTKQLHEYASIPGGSIKIDNDKEIVIRHMTEPSLNHEPNRLRDYTVSENLRRITIEIRDEFRIRPVLLQAFVLGRLRIFALEPRVMTHWVVFLDSQKNLWAFNADTVGPLENDYQEPEFYLEPGEDQYDDYDDLFGKDIQVVKLGTVSELRNYVVQKVPMKFHRVTGVHRWTSTQEFLVYATISWLLCPSKECVGGGGICSLHEP